MNVIRAVYLSTGRRVPGSPCVQRIEVTAWWYYERSPFLKPTGGNIKQTASPRNPAPIRIATRVVAERSSAATIKAVRGRSN